ncbi:unnamed protein product (macronuclear) [Paramecium tetraurelia]|uniref:Chromosome undetermined scaffold_1, whole genome shotgun sequence n=1 Tax=Paramecium tetraurelia TaxID=5888 RepID=Q6BFZ6_PARTE|nr:hypothetical protein [Paramecium tetraurelia strain d4-2]XP_001423256.1 uncharacterized protein GSPATT00000293001 [Paramecium tetraurelia]CAH03424.1 hypothetical protein PTMB.226c [Paramecium tetraurelia]CAK55858.1 unnamed protein product [Paramecium tetraurelia]|eukprot:XP_001423256.1 hypothetical protein (macronuclear) [Paramecium tetraurelia strain d4-2]
MGSRIKVMPNLDTPGPGKYHPIIPFRSSPKAVMSGSKDSFYKIADSPGPGRYNQLSYTTHGFKFPQEKRIILNFKDSPSPAKHNQEAKLFAPACYIPKVERKQKINYHVTGPGSYNIPSLLRSDIGFKIPKGQRKNKKEIFPGPGEYSFQESKTKGIKIGTSPRMEKSMLLGPGPQDYSPRIATDTSPRAVFGTASRGNSKKEKSPGPADYELPQSRSVSFSFPKQIVHQHSKPSTPLSYINDYTSLRKTSVSFGKAQKRIPKKAEIIPV